MQGSRSEVDEWKRRAAERAVSCVRSGMVLGLGSGSTAMFALARIAEQLRTGALTAIVGVPSSKQTEADARRLGIPLTTLDEHPRLDLTIDGADEVAPDLGLIKGGGGALLREKVVAQASRRELIIIDETKRSPRLGTQFALPVEVLPFACAPERLYLSALGADVTLRRNERGAPYLTDQGNCVLDCKFGPIAEPGELARKLEARAGIVAHGLFLGLATGVIIAGREGLSYLGDV